MKTNIKHILTKLRSFSPGHRILFISITGGIFVLATVASIFIPYYGKAAELEASRQSIEKHGDAISALEQACLDLFQNELIRDSVSQQDLNGCKTVLAQSNSAETEGLSEEIKNAENYLEVKASLEKLFDKNGIFLSNTSEKTLQATERVFSKLAQKYQNLLVSTLEEAKSEFGKISTAKAKVSSLNPETASRSEYEDAKRSVDALLQQDLKTELSFTLEETRKNVETREKIAAEKAEAERKERERIRREQEEAERQRQAAIAAAWKTIDVPYISQNQAGIHNGCEAASLLMALKYRGILSGESLNSFVEKMPMSDDPSTGFYLDVYDREPTTEAHWIDTEPLVAFGRSSSGYDAIYDLSGSDLSVLRDEVVAGNPVIIYLTFDFSDPYNYSKGVPKNLHVMVLSGYNEITGEYRVTDPWTRNGYLFFLSQDRITTLYNQVGRRAIVVR